MRLCFRVWILLPVFLIPLLTLAGGKGNVEKGKALFRMNQNGIRHNRRDACDESHELSIVDLLLFREDGGNLPVFPKKVGRDEDQVFGDGLPNNFPRCPPESEGGNQYARVDDEFISLSRRLFSGSS